MEVDVVVEVDLDVYEEYVLWGGDLVVDVVEGFGYGEEKVVDVVGEVDGDVDVGEVEVVVEINEVEGNDVVIDEFFEVFVWFFYVE